MHKLALLISLLIVVAACKQQRDAAAAQPLTANPAVSFSSTHALVDAEEVESTERHALASESTQAPPDFRLTARVVDTAGNSLVGAAWSWTRLDRRGFNREEIASGVTGPTGTIDIPMSTHYGTMYVRYPGLCTAVVSAQRTRLSSTTDLGVIELEEGGALVATLPPGLDVHAEHGWRIRASLKSGQTLESSSVNRDTRAARLENLRPGPAVLSVRLGNGAHTFLYETQHVEVIAGQTVEVQLQPNPYESGVDWLFKLEPSWAPLGNSRYGLDVRSKDSRISDWPYHLAYAYKPTYRLFRRGELVFEVDDLEKVEPFEDREGPFVLEVEHEAIESFRSRPFHAISHLTAVIRGHCSLRVLATSAATGQQLPGASVIVSRIGPELYQQVHKLGPKATIDGLPPEEFIVHVDAPGYARCTVTVPELKNHEQREVRAELMAEMGARGSVVYEGGVAPAVEVHLQIWQDDEWQYAGWAATDVRGNFEITANTQGRYRVFVACGSRPSSAEFEVTPGNFVDVGTLVLDSLTRPTSR